MVKDKDPLKLSLARLPVIRPLVSLTIGILLSHFCAIPYSSYLPYIILFILLFLCITQLTFFVSYRKKMFSPAYISLMLLLGIWLNVQQKPYANPRHHSHYQTAQLIGIVDDEPIDRGKTIRFPLKITHAIDTGYAQEVEGRVMISLRKDSSSHQDIRYGDLLQIKNKLQAIPSAYNPKEFDYRAYLANRGIYQQGFLSNSDFKVIDRKKGNFIIDQSLQFRQKLIAKFSKYLQDPDGFQIAVALIFGYRTQMDSDTIEVFTDSGTIHVLSVSGLHVSIVFGLFSYLLFWLDRFRYGKLIRCVLIFIAIWGYVILTGMSPPILRAGIMISFFILALAFRRRQVALNTLLASALFILLISPHNLFDIGFQLSYLALLGILLLYPLLCQMWLPQNRWHKYLIEYSYISIAAQLFTLPFVLQYFGQLPTYFLPANLFIALPSTLIMYLGFALAVAPWEFLSIPIGILLDAVLNFTLDGLHFIVQLPSSVFRGVIWTIPQTLMSCMLLLFLITTINYRHKKSLFILLGLSLMIVAHSTIIRLRYSSYEGLKMYNIRSEMALAYIDNGKVLLLSSLDSINHPTLLFSVLPDLKCYSPMEEIQFAQVKKDKLQNYYVELGNRRILVLEEPLHAEEQAKFDLIIWRRNNKNALSAIRRKHKKAKIILDGSNSTHYLADLPKLHKEDQAIYILKNNFAYVWDKE